MHNNILVSSLDTQLKIIHGRTQEVTGSVFNIAPFITCNIHTTHDKKVLISAKSPVPGGRCKVIVMDQAGNRLTEYENDSNNKPLFTFAYMLTSTSKGYICIIDKLDVDFRGRVLVIGQGGTIKGIYTGHADVNTEDNPFTPLDILATPSDNILIADWKISVIHILNSDGNFISFFSAYDIGIQYPHSLALSTPGKLYIGCGSGVESPEHYEAKLYEVEYSGM
ncbi:TRIM2_3 [Mytilus edulis]|uniref:TRIM2_3 n=1 Tax=Mytilus edulis TaxID=6550 RepID=A0A8S3T8U0_MYTED|nr:TRIM2_3 [Mytilus edulis]